MSLRTADYHYDLPEELIARYPLEKREASRILVLDRQSGGIEHRHFSDFPSYIRPGDCVVLNDTKVIPARVFSDDGGIELLLLEQKDTKAWICMVKPGRKMRVGRRITVSGIGGEVLEVLPNGERHIAFDAELDLERVGQMPLPPYLGRTAEKGDSQRYQTVYASKEGAVAAPTAGLHFTPEILAQIPHTFVTLHVGAGTFKPVQVEDITQHQMHRERYSISGEAAARIAGAKRRIAIGTTSVRTLESCMATHGQIIEAEGSTDIFIYPPHKITAVDALLTNFHLPCSTLLMLVSAFAGRELILRAYAEAIRERYRFYSYGDCMLIL